jgi:hypothetical protein
MKHLWLKLITKMLAYAEHALLDVICLQEMGMTPAELSHFLPASFPNNHEAHYTATLAQAKNLDMMPLSPKLGTNYSQKSS